MPTYLAPGVYVEEVSSGSKPIEGVGTSVCAFVGFAEKGPLNEPLLITNWSQFTQTFGDFIPGSYLAPAVYGYFLNGGGTAYVVRIGSDDPEQAPPPRAEIPAVDANGKPAFTVRAVAAGPEGDQLAVEVVEPSEPAEDVFKLVVKRGGDVVETFDNVTLKRGNNNVSTVVKQRSKLITVEDAKQAGALAVPTRNELVPLVGTLAAQTRAVEASDYVGSSSDRTGFAGLEAIDEITMLCVPDLMMSYQQGGIDLEGVKAVQLAMIAHCELMADRLAVLDTPPGLNVQQVKDWRMNIAGYDSKFAAMYWPWVKVMDTVSGKPVFIPPSGHVAGIWARNDATRGVHKAPANEVVRGAVALELGISRVEQEQLNPVAVNCLRAFPGQGIRVWGARTLSSDPEWRYINVRRLFNFVEESILQGTNWVVFEPNDPKLWDSVKRTITMFLRGVWRDGALYGRTPGDSFFVKCDEENNPPESRDQGILSVEVGIAPVKPAEFVVFRISQYSDGSALEE
ncbi:phage tail sheath family protein [Umezawaea sp. Da 62-37]|uniref:phage tail sheath family protein n=1 Tax=Umezawaea sp. Da 62-37 TaxID=3075927 RepID=UPI0028F6F3BC|nr:phage tail sheath family protein [Umezawaea sp. Da 62-37]WNV87984.1 phage tail sheath family protein [Umezawaea sp. Da 62-37]